MIKKTTSKEKNNQVLKQEKSNILALKDRLDNIQNIEVALVSDEELNLEKLNAIMPDTWANISWTI